MLLTRAITDMILEAVLRNENPDFVPLDEWMPTNNDKRKVLVLPDRARPHLTSLQLEAITKWVTKRLAE